MQHQYTDQAEEIPDKTNGIIRVDKSGPPMDLTLVPFGYKVSTDQLVDVQQVPSGKRCGCICPSCKAPLVARKGTKKVWHFAHDSKGELQNKLEKCSFSFYVSARMMARQMIGDRLSVNLPRLEVTLTEKEPFSNDHIHVDKIVTEARTIVLEDISLDTRIAEHRVDLSGVTGGYCLAFVFTHPGRNEFDHLANLDKDKTGIVAISLTGLRERFHEFKESNRPYSDILADYIASDIFSKKWIYHPRLHETEQLAQSLMEQKVAAAKKPFEQQVKLQEKPMKFTCRNCKSSWTGGSSSNESCRQCGASALMVGRTEIPDTKQ